MNDKSDGATFLPMNAVVIAWVCDAEGVNKT